MKFIKTLTVSLIIFIISTNDIYSQVDAVHVTKYTLEELKTYSSDPSYSLYPYYERSNFSYSKYFKKADFEIYGDMHNYDFCLKLIATLGPLLKLDRKPKIALHFYNQNINDFQEILFLSAIEKHYPSHYIKYLLSRAAKLFQGDKIKDLERLNIDKNKIEELINTPFVALHAKAKIEKSIFLQESKFYHEGYPIYPSIYLFYNALQKGNPSPCCDRFSSFIECIYDSKVHPISLAMAILKLPPHLEQLEENPTKEEIESISNAIFNNASQEILQECLETCVRDICISHENYCGDSEMCISYIAEVDNSNPFRSNTKQQKSKCIECPSNINVTDNGVYFNLDFDDLPEISNATPNIYNPNTYPSFPWTAYIHIRECSFEYPILRNQPFFISASDINQLLEQVSVGLEDEICFELHPPTVYARNKGCIKQQCITFDCPNISLSKQNGIRTLSVSNFEPLIWGQSSFEIDWDNVRYEINKNIRIELPITDQTESTANFHRTNNCGERIADFGCNIGLDITSSISNYDRNPIKISNIISKKMTEGYDVTFTIENVLADSFDIQIINSEIDGYSSDQIPIVECKGQNCSFQTKFGFGNWCFTITEPHTGNKIYPPIEICKFIEAENVNCSLKNNNLSTELTVLDSYENCNGFAKIHVDENLKESVLVDWGSGIGPTSILVRHDLSPGSYNIDIYLRENNMFCFAKTINFNIEAEFNLAIPTPRISMHASVTKKSGISFGNRSYNGNKSYTYKWNNGTKTLDNHRAIEAGNYRLTATDANGYSVIKSWKRNLKPQLPSINNAEIIQINYKTGIAKLQIDYSLPANLSYQDHELNKFAIEYNLTNDSDSIQSIYLQSTKRKNSVVVRIDKKYSNGMLTLTPFITKKRSSSSKQLGPTSIHCIPDFESLSEFHKTKISVIGDKSSNCKFDTYSLVGFCGSHDSCKIISTSLDVLKVPFGSFDIPLDEVNTSFFAEIQPVLNGGLSFNPSNGISTGLTPASTFSTTTRHGQDNWSEGESCNCFEFKIDINDQLSPNQTFRIQNHINNPDGVHLTQTDEKAVILCAEQSGTYCLSVIEGNGCIIDYCRDINIGEIEIATFSTRFKNFYPEPDGELLIILDDSTPAPVQWKYSIAGVKVKDKSDTKLHLKNLHPGKYEVEVTDANDCTRKIPFTIYRCGSSSRNIDEQITEYNSNSSEQVLFGMSLPSVNNKYQINTNLLRESNTWIYPDGTKTKGVASIIPTQTGYYKLRIPTPCGGLNWAGRGYINPNDAFPDKIDVSLKNSKSSKQSICVDLKTIKGQLQFLPSDYSFVSLEARLNNSNNPRILYSKSFSRKNINQLLDSEFCATLEKGDHAPYDMTITLEWQRNVNTKLNSASIDLQVSR